MRNTVLRVGIENRKLMKVSTIKDKSLADTFAFVGLFSVHTCPTPFPTPQTKLNVCFQNFFEFQHCVGWREGVLQEHFAKDELFYEGIHKLQKIMNTALLSQALHPLFCIAYGNSRFSSLLAAGDVSRGGTSATQRQKFHTDGVN